MAVVKGLPWIKLDGKCNKAIASKNNIAFLIPIKN